MRAMATGSMRRRAALGAGLLLLALQTAQAQQVLTIAAFPAVDEIVKSAIPAWKCLHPTVDIKVVSRQFSNWVGLVIAFGLAMDLWFSRNQA